MLYVRLLKTPTDKRLVNMKNTKRRQEISNPNHLGWLRFLIKVFRASRID
jgi:hypothetical protein